MSAVALALADVVDDRTASPDGYVRLAVDADTWTALAEGCAAGHHDLGALWADDGRMCLALSAPSPGIRAIVSIETEGGRNYTAGEYSAWLDETGFCDIQTVRFEAAGANGVVLARKP